MSLTQLKELYKWSLLKYEHNRSDGAAQVCEKLRKLIQAMEN